MKKGRFTEEQIIGILKQHEAGRRVPELAREIGVSDATIYTWKSKYGGMEVGEAQRLKGLEDENRRLRHLVADLSLDKVPHYSTLCYAARRLLKKGRSSASSSRPPCAPNRAA